MKTNRDRYDHRTAHLLSLEERIGQSLASCASGAIEAALEEIHSAIESLPSIRTSKELDHLLQLTMLFITSRLASQCSETKAEPYKATISVYYPKHRAISVKPSFYSPGRCSVKHTTI